MMMIETAISSRSRRSGILRRMHSLYFHANSIPSRAYDTLSKLGVVMHRNLVYKSVTLIMMALQANESFSKAVREHQFFGAHDNVNLDMEVYEQRLDKRVERGHSDGSVGIGVIIKDATIQLPTREEFCEQRTRIGQSNPLTAAEILQLEAANTPALTEFAEFFILNCLLKFTVAEV
jgi:hypothetical protein